MTFLNCAGIATGNGLALIIKACTLVPNVMHQAAANPLITLHADGGTVVVVHHGDKMQINLMKNHTAKL